MNTLAYFTGLRVIFTFAKMTRKRNIKVKLLLVKWLLIPALFVSLFSFAGPVGQSSLQPQKTQTEFVFSNTTKPRYKVADYKQQIPCPLRALDRTSIRYNNTLLAYCRLSKVKFNRLSHQSVFITTRCLLRHIKTIPQSSDEDIAALPIG